MSRKQSFQFPRSLVPRIRARADCCPHKDGLDVPDSPITIFSTEADEPLRYRVQAPYGRRNLHRLAAKLKRDPSYFARRSRKAKSDGSCREVADSRHKAHRDYQRLRFEPPLQPGEISYRTAKRSAWRGSFDTLLEIHEEVYSGAVQRAYKRALTFYRSAPYQLLPNAAYLLVWVGLAREKARGELSTSLDSVDVPEAELEVAS